MYVDIASKYRMVNGEKQHILTLIDVTDREMNKMALEKSEVNYKMLVDTSPNGIIIRDFENVYYANDVALSILGCKNKEEINFEKMMDPCSVKTIERRLRTVETGGKVDFVEIELKKLNSGEKVTIETKPVWINYKGKSAFQIVFRNISVEKLLMEEKVKKRLLEENNRKLTEEIAYRIEIEDELKSMIDENKVLLNEVHHRVKNNYQVVSSMLNRCLLKVSDTASIKAIMASKSRLVSMAIVGDFFHDAQNFNAISLIDFLKKIFSHFIRENGSGWSNERIKFTTYIRKLVVNIAQATTIGLIFNEILSLLLQLSEKFNDNYCTFVSLKWQNSKEIVFTVKFDYNITSEIEKSLDSTDEIVFIREMLEQVDGLLVCHCKNAELNLIIKLTKIS
jgi:two-component sensor histidine kinase